jgi:hypothetical protein
MGVIVSYSYSAWQAQFPKLASIPTDTVEAYWTMAEGFHANDGSGPVKSAALQTMLMNLMAGHLMMIFGSMSLANDGTITAGPVGRVNSATEGSVSVGTENQYPPGTDQWFQQTAFGSAYWLATSQFRRMSYRPGPQRQFNPPVFGPGYFGGQWGG